MSVSRPPMEFPITTHCSAALPLLAATKSHSNSCQSSSEYLEREGETTGSVERWGRG